jgi:hypothetical protein
MCRRVVVSYQSEEGVGESVSNAKEGTYLTLSQSFFKGRYIAIVDVFGCRVAKINPCVNRCNVRTTGVNLEVLQRETDEIKIKVSPHILMPILEWA